MKSFNYRKIKTVYSIILHKDKEIVKNLQKIEFLKQLIFVDFN
jgi:hypothetical protein